VLAVNTELSDSTDLFDKSMQIRCTWYVDDSCDSSCCLWMVLFYVMCILH